MHEILHPGFVEVCHDKLWNGKHIDKGSDSTVYHVGDRALKSYEGLIAFPKVGQKLARYREITNTASALAIAEDWQIKFPFEHKEFKLRVNPIDWITECPTCGVYVGSSLFIEGPNLGKSDNFNHTGLKVELNYAAHFVRERLGVYQVEFWHNNAKEIPGDIILITDLCTQISEL